MKCFSRFVGCGQRRTEKPIKNLQNTTANISVEESYLFNDAVPHCFSLREKVLGLLNHRLFQENLQICVFPCRKSCYAWEHGTHCSHPLPLKGAGGDSGLSLPCQDTVYPGKEGMAGFKSDVS